MLVDWEIHATAYRSQQDAQRDAQMTLESIARRCAQLGLSHVGILDHLAPDRGMGPEPLRAILADSRQLQPPAGLRVWLGAEVDIGEDGCLSELPQFRKELALDYVIGSAHAGHRQDETDAEYCHRQFEMMVNVLQPPCPIDVLGHPWGGRLLDQVPEDMLRELLRACVSVGVGVELTPRFGAGTSDLELLVRCAVEEGALLAPASDAHACDHLGDTLELHEIMEKLGAANTNLWLPQTAAEA